MYELFFLDVDDYLDGKVAAVVLQNGLKQPWG
jgi:hypothetical protein